MWTMWPPFVTNAEMQFLFIYLFLHGHCSNICMLHDIFITLILIIFALSVSRLIRKELNIGPDNWSFLYLPSQYEWCHRFSRSPCGLFTFPGYSGWGYPCQLLLCPVAPFNPLRIHPHSPRHHAFVGVTRCEVQTMGLVYLPPHPPHSTLMLLSYACKYLRRSGRVFICFVFFRTDLNTSTQIAPFPAGWRCERLFWLLVPVSACHDASRAWLWPFFFLKMMPVFEQIVTRFPAAF